MKFVAEFGSNWLGKPSPKDMIEQLIGDAANAGATAVKFQYFTADGLYSKKRAPELHAKFKELELGEKNLEIAAQFSAMYGLELWASVFSPNDVWTVGRYADVVKIASGDIDYTRLLQEVNVTKKPVAISTGGALDYEIVEALSGFEDKPILFYCVSEYPALPEDFRLGGILKYRDQASEIGLSDHSKGSIVAMLAAAMGYTVFEKHFKSPYTSIESPDFGVSEFPKNFAGYVTDVKLAADIASGSKKYITQDEFKERLWARRGKDGLRPTDEVGETGGLITGDRAGVLVMNSDGLTTYGASGTAQFHVSEDEDKG